VREVEMGRICSLHGDMITHKNFRGKTEQKRLLGRPGCKWENNIKIDLVELGCKNVDWIQLAQNQVHSPVNW
jgi:hypothetical protein